MTRVVDPRLRRRRTLLLAWSAPVVALALVAAIFLLFIASVGGVATAAYQDGRDEGALRSYDVLTGVNVVERWKAPYGQGTMRYVLGQAFTATLALERAWELVPHHEPVASDDECRVAINLSLAYETLGDDALAAGDAEAAVEYFQAAVNMSDLCTLDARVDDESANPEMSGEGTSANVRQREKLEQSQSDSDSDDGEGEGDGGGGGGSDDGDGEGGEGSDGDQGGDGGQDEGEGGGGADGDQDGDGNPGEGDDQGGSDGQDGSQPDDGGTDPDDGGGHDGGSGSVFDELRERNQEANDIGDEEEQSGGGGDGGGQNW